MSTTPPSTGTKGRWADLDRRSKEEETKSIQRWKNDPSGGNVPSADRTPLHRLVASWRSASSSSSKEVEDLRSKDRCTQRIGALPVSPSLRMGFSLTIDHARGLPRLGPGFHNRFRAIGCGPHPVGSIRHPESEDGAEGWLGSLASPWVLLNYLFLPSPRHLDWNQTKDIDRVEREEGSSPFVPPSPSLDRTGPQLAAFHRDPWTHRRKTRRVVDETKQRTSQRRAQRTVRTRRNTRDTT